MNLSEAVNQARAYTSDSRNVQAGDIFVALTGEKSDGHQFVEQVLAKNPVAVVVKKDFVGDDARLIKVENTQAAHRELASQFRKKFKTKIIAVGGSNGKTSTKEFIYTLLSQKYQCVKTDQSQNGELGIPKTLERLGADVVVAVVEVGIDAPGDMVRHAQLVQPDVAVLTSIGEEHLNLLKSVENVFKEESILFEVTLARQGQCFAPAADPWLKKLAGKGVTLTEPFVEAIDSTFKSPLQHMFAAQNAALAVRVAMAMGMTKTEIAEAVKKLELPEGRGNVFHWRKDFIVVADHYNANRSSMRAGLEFAAHLATAEGLPLRLILGDMLDLGPETKTAHATILPDILKSHASEIILIGPELKHLETECKKRVSHVHTFENSEKAKPCAAKLVEKAGVIFLKGSHGMALEHCLSAMQLHLKNLAS